MPLASGGRIRYSAKTKRKVVSNRIEFTFFSAFSYLLMPVACNPVPVLVADMYGVLVIVWSRCGLGRALVMTTNLAIRFSLTTFHSTLPIHPHLDIDI